VKSRYSNIVVLLAAIAAFLPVMAVDYLLDSYVRVRERAQLQQAIDSTASSVEAMVNDSVASLRRLLADSPSLCTPTFIANVHKQMERSLFVKQVLVENGDGVQYCDALGRQVNHSPLSETLSVAGNTETITVVKLGELDMPVLKITQAFGSSRLVSVFVPMLGTAADALLAGLKPTASVRISLTNGVGIVTVGGSSGFDEHGGTEFVTAESFAGAFPLRAEAAVPFGIVRGDYADLDTSFTIIACLMSGAFLVLSLQYVRRSDLPAFDLERAIMAGELKPYYQPVINLRTGRLAGCEVLCRWEKKNGDIVPPGAFIEYAEVTGLAIPMTVSLMQQVKSDLAELCREMPELKISFNLFEGHFRDGTVVDDVQAIFAGSSISFRQLVFEITERRPLEDSLQVNSVIAGLHALGCRLAMDDAGTGHSNLAYMQTLGIDVIKIDRVFVDMIKPGTTQVPVLDALIAMARDLGTEIVAEGVETEAQALYLRARGVVMAQGFLFAPAIRVEPFKELATALNGAPRPAGVEEAAAPASAATAAA
jgi:EAL domain-containing protein (putative c-di-GMP-specific phosphodiesterase class I)